MTYYTADTHSQAYIHTLTRELRAFMYASSKTSLLLFVRECTRALAPSRNENRVFARRSTNGNGFRINTELTCIPPTGIHTRPHLYHINAQLYNYMDASHPANTYAPFVPRSGDGSGRVARRILMPGQLRRRQRRLWPSSGRACECNT